MIDNDVVALIERLCGIDRNQQVNVFFEKGCEHADAYKPEAAFTPAFWKWFAEEYNSVEMEFIMYAMCMRKNLRDNKQLMVEERQFLHDNRKLRMTIEINRLLTV